MKGFELGGLRKQAEVIQSVLADHLGIHNNTLTDIERGRIGVDEETYTRIKEAISLLANQRQEIVAA